MQYNRKVCRCELYASGTAFGDIVSLDTVISSYLESHSITASIKTRLCYQLMYGTRKSSAMLTASS